MVPGAKHYTSVLDPICFGTKHLNRVLITRWCWGFYVAEHPIGPTMSPWTLIGLYWPLLNDALKVTFSTLMSDTLYYMGIYSQI